MQPDDLTYPHRIRGEAWYAGLASCNGSILRPEPTGVRLANRAYTNPFCAVRSDDILPLAEACFESVHTARYGAVFPLPFYLDLEAIAREEPALLVRING